MSKSFNNITAFLVEVKPVFQLHQPKRKMRQDYYKKI